MASNSSGFTIAAGMGMVVLLMGYTLLNAADLVGFSSEPQTELVVAQNDSTANLPQAWCGNMRNVSSPEEAADIAAGDALFKGNCAQCHAVNEKVVGPALAGITKRRPISWLIPWVKNSSKVVACGDEYAVKIFNEYAKQQMPSFQLSDKEIESIMKYVDSTSGMGIAYNAEVAVSCQ